MVHSLYNSAHSGQNSRLESFINFAATQFSLIIMTLAPSEKSPSKSFVRGEWPRGLNQKVPGSKPTRCSFGFRNPTCYDQYRVSEAVPPKMAQNCSWDSQIAVQKNIFNTKVWILNQQTCFQNVLKCKLHSHSWSLFCEYLYQRNR